MKIALFIVGEPGVGKTAVARRLLETPKASLSIIDSPKWTIGKRWAAAGHYIGGTFDGADTVPYNGVSNYIEYWRRFIKLNTIFDGDRFSNRSALQAISSSRDTTAVCILLKAAPGVAERRRQMRGSVQNDVWIKGRKTKALRFFDLFPPANRIEITNLGTPSHAADAIDHFVKAMLR